MVFWLLLASLLLRIRFRSYRFLSSLCLLFFFLAAGILSLEYVTVSECFPRRISEECASKTDVEMEVVLRRM